jgi:hypothetical protein
MESAIARALSSAGLSRTSRLGVTQTPQRAPAPAEPPQPLRPPVFARPPSVQRHPHPGDGDADASNQAPPRPTTEAPELPQGRERSSEVTERPGWQSASPLPPSGDLSDALVEPPPMIGTRRGAVTGPPPFTRPRSNAMSGSPPDLGQVGDPTAPTEGSSGWRSAEPTQQTRTEPLPLRIGQQRDDYVEEEPDVDISPRSRSGKPDEPEEKDESSKEKTPPIDLLQLARDILPHVKRLMLVERERRPRS